MITQKKNRLMTKTFAGLELVMKNQEEIDYYNIVLLSKERNNIKTSMQKSNIKHFEEIKKILKSHISLAIVISGKGLFYKKINQKNIAPEEALNVSLPGALSEDFCFQLSPTIDGTWISILRVKTLDIICKNLEKEGFFPNHITFGPLAIQHLYPFVSGTPDHIDLTDYKVLFRDGQITEIQSQESGKMEKVLIAGDQVPQELIPVLAATFANFMKISNPIYNTDLLIITKRNFHYTRLFRLTSLGVLFSFLLLLSFSTLFFFNFSKKNKAYSKQLELHQKQLEELKLLQNIQEEKRLFIKQQSSLSASRKSFFADEIAATIPRGIQLDKMNIFPETLSLRKRKNTSPLFKKNSIEIKGNTIISALLNDWINALENLTWIERVTLLPYKELENGIGSFELEINIKNIN